ncbi:hypothetical protein [Paracoccus sp. SY]|uniref:hypothetical protein n=1 Tax=Paracoccus sp. SY TaxID=1330255 RepID=UPI001304D6F5|nr:hypothetical protein [Paracoccus sp. SY]
MLIVGAMRGGGMVPGAAPMRKTARPGSRAGMSRAACGNRDACRGLYRACARCKSGDVPVEDVASGAGQGAHDRPFRALGVK